jgi:hypothetical protein
MIKLNTPYTIENGDKVTFTEGKKGTINGSYSDATLTGSLEGDLLKATFHNTKVNASGLIEITFHENGFDAKWKNGLEPGPMRGKWEGKFSDIDSVTDGQTRASAAALSDEQMQYLEEGITLEDFDAEYQGGDDGKVAWMKEKTFLLEAIKQDVRILKHASDELKADRELVKEAIKNDINAIDYADEKLQCDPELLIARIIAHFDGEENILINDDDINIFVDGSEFYDPLESIEKLLFKVEYLLLKKKKEEFISFHNKIIELVNEHRECFWIIQAILKVLNKITVVIDNLVYYNENEETSKYYDEVSELINSFETKLNFLPSIEFETYFKDSEIYSSWDECKWASREDEDGFYFTEFILNKTNMEWDTESWSNVKFYNYSISCVWIGLQNYSLKQSREGFDEENMSVCLYSLIDEKYDPIRDSGCADYGIYTFRTIIEYLFGMKRYDYDLNETDRDDLEEFNGWQFDLNKVASELCNSDLFDDWPGASEFDK